ncbi:MAG: aldo/keto reductase [Pseudomonadota bacterium]
MANKIRVIREGVDLGMTLLDSGDAYEGGHAEEILGRAIRGIRGNVWVCTKFEPERSHYRGVFESVEASLKRLRTDYIDLYQAHWPIPSEIPMAETMGALSALADQGKIRFIGVCNWSPDEIVAANALLENHSIVSVQTEYNLLNKTFELDLQPFCRENEITTFAYSIFNQGNLSLAGHEAIERICRDRGLTPHQVIIAWVLSTPGVAPILRTNNPHHNQANVAVLNVRLDAEELRGLDRMFPREPSMVDVSEIEVLNHDVDDTHPIYTTLDQALSNRLGLKPSPEEIAEEFRSGRSIRPVELIAGPSGGGPKYLLLHGRLRYWGWVIAHSGRKPIPAFILHRQSGRAAQGPLATHGRRQ